MWVGCYGLLSIKKNGISQYFPIGFDPKNITALADQLRGGASLTLLSSLGL